MRVPKAIAAALSLALGAFGCSGGGGGGDGGGPTAPTAPQTSLVVTLPSSTFASREPVQAVAKLVTGATSVPASNVHWSSDNRFIAAIDSNGVITGERAGNTRITATSDGKTGSVQVTVTPGSPVAVVIFVGNNQTGTVGLGLKDPLCTLVKDAAGNFIIGALVTYTVTTGGGHILDPRTVATDGEGIATSGQWILGLEKGSQTVTATASGATSTVFTATAQ